MGEGEAGGLILRKEVALQQAQESISIPSDIAQADCSRQSNPPILLLSAYADMPERILWLVDEYLMKSEMPERLVRVIERAMRPCRAASA